MSFTRLLQLSNSSTLQPNERTTQLPMNQLQTQSPSHAVSQTHEYSGMKTVFSNSLQSFVLIISQTNIGDGDQKWFQTELTQIHECLSPDSILHWNNLKVHLLIYNSENTWFKYDDSNHKRCSSLWKQPWTNPRLCSNLRPSTTLHLLALLLSESITRDSLE
jgi:hypothetical protein